MMTPRLRLGFRKGSLGALGAAAAIALIALPSFAQTPLDDPLDARDAKRVDRMEKVVRELRDIVFKAQKTGGPWSCSRPTPTRGWPISPPRAPTSKAR